MAKEVGIRDAQRHLSRLIREMEAGQEIVITRRGVPVARIVPVRGKKRVLTPEQEAAWEHTLKRMEEGIDLGGYKFRREDACEEI